MQCGQGEVKVKMVTLNGYSSCSMENCEGQHQEESRKAIHFLKVEAHFPQVDEKSDHEEINAGMALVKVFETNFRSKPEINAAIIGQLIEGDIVSVTAEDQGWVRVQNKERVGWVPRDVLVFHQEVLFRRQVKGETHASYICEKCAEKVDWQWFYLKEIERKQVGHVISNYTFDYAEMSLAMENKGTGGEVSRKELDSRIQDEIKSGNHGLSKRFNSNKVINYLLRHRPAS